MGNNRRTSGFYWVILSDGEDYQIAEYFEDSECWNLIGSEIPYYDNEFDEIDENEISRLKKITVDCGFNLPVKDLTKPMGHDMNHFQRNFMDSTH